MKAMALRSINMFFICFILKSNYFDKIKNNLTMNLNRYVPVLFWMKFYNQ